MTLLEDISETVLFSEFLITLDLGGSLSKKSCQHLPKIIAF